MWHERIDPKMIGIRVARVVLHLREALWRERFMKLGDLMRQLSKVAKIDDKREGRVVDLVAKRKDTLGVDDDRHASQRERLEESCRGIGVSPHVEPIVALKKIVRHFLLETFELLITFSLWREALAY